MVGDPTLQITQIFTIHGNLSPILLNKYSTSYKIFYNTPFKLIPNLDNIRGRCVILNSLVIMCRLLLTMNL